MTLQALKRTDRTFVADDGGLNASSEGTVSPCLPYQVLYSGSFNPLLCRVDDRKFLHGTPPTLETIPDPSSFTLPRAAAKKRDHGHNGYRGTKHSKEDGLRTSLTADALRASDSLSLYRKSG